MDVTLIDVGLIKSAASAPLARLEMPMMRQCMYVMARHGRVPVSAFGSPQKPQRGAMACVGAA
jgi:hypothetical protein